MAQELLYTSAPRGLKPGSRGFCTVEATAGMSPALVSILEGLSGYRHVAAPGDPANPVVWSHVTVPLGGRGYHVLSRVADAGSDYTGRTNKIAHHLVLEGSERPKGGPAWLLSRPDLLRAGFRGEPRTLPPRTIAGGDRAPGVCAAWKSAAGDAGWGGVLAEAYVADPNRPAYLVVAPGADVKPLFEEAIALLPAERRWGVTFTTCLTTLPQNVTCLWRAVLAGSPEAHDSRRYVQALRIDLTAALPPAVGGRLVESARTGRMPAVPAAPPPTPASGAAPQAALAGSEEMLDEMPAEAIRPVGPRPVRLAESLVPPKLVKRSRARVVLLSVAAVGCVGVMVAPFVVWLTSSLGKNADKKPNGEQSVSVAAADRAAKEGVRETGTAKAENAETTKPDASPSAAPAARERSSTETASLPQQTSTSSTATAHDEQHGTRTDTASVGVPDGIPVNPRPSTDEASQAGEASQTGDAGSNIEATVEGHRARAEAPLLAHIAEGLKPVAVDGAQRAYYVTDERLADPGITAVELWIPKWLGDRGYTTAIDGGVTIVRAAATGADSEVARVAYRPNESKPSVVVELKRANTTFEDALPWCVVFIPATERAATHFVLLSPAAEIHARSFVNGLLQWPIPGIHDDLGIELTDLTLGFHGKAFAFVPTKKDGRSVLYTSSQFNTSIEEANPDVLGLSEPLRENPPTVKLISRDGSALLSTSSGGAWRPILRALADKNGDMKVVQGQLSAVDSKWKNKHAAEGVGLAAFFPPFDSDENKPLTSDMVSKAQVVIGEILEKAETESARSGRKGFVGNVNLSTLRGVLETYLGALRQTLLQREEFSNATILSARLTYPAQKPSNTSYEPSQPIFDVELIRFDGDVAPASASENIDVGNAP